MGASGKFGGISVIPGHGFALPPNTSNALNPKLKEIFDTLQIASGLWLISAYQRYLVWLIVLRIGLKNQNRLIGNSEQSIIDYNRFSACFVRKTEYSFLPNIITVVFR